MKLLRWKSDDAYIRWLCCASADRPVYTDKEDYPRAKQEYAKPVATHAGKHRPRSQKPAPAGTPAGTPAGPRGTVTRCQSLRSHPVTSDSIAAIEHLPVSRPTEFRHLESGSTRREPLKYRPLQLSIYLPNNRLSPLTPLFGAPEDDTSLKPQTTDEPQHDPLTTSRSGYENDAGIPKPAAAIPRLTATARTRNEEDLPSYQRLKSAIYEKFELEEQLRNLEGMIERKSICISRPASRAANASDRVFNILDLQEPCPSGLPSTLPAKDLPALRKPKSAPHLDIRSASPQTFARVIEPLPALPNKLVSQTKPRTPSKERPLPPPPLPLQLTSAAPARNQQSLSRVSNWLRVSEKTDQRIEKNMSRQTVTNSPRPLTSQEGYYQCIDTRPHSFSSGRPSVESVSSLSSATDSHGHGTVVSTVSPDTTPRSIVNRDPKRLGSMDLTKLNLQAELLAAHARSEPTTKLVAVAQRRPQETSPHEDLEVTRRHREDQAENGIDGFEDGFEDNTDRQDLLADQDVAADDTSETLGDDTLQVKHPLMASGHS